jgi:co-chaperonin GroES (HSP10)
VVTSVVQSLEFEVKIGKGRILVQRSEAPKTTSGGFIIPDAMREQPDYGCVVEVGAGVTDWKKDDKVLFPKWSGFSISIPGDSGEYLIVLEEEVWASL